MFKRRKNIEILGLPLKRRLCGSWGAVKPKFSSQKRRFERNPETRFFVLSISQVHVGLLLRTRVQSVTFSGMGNLHPPPTFFTM